MKYAPMLRASALAGLALLAPAAAQERGSDGSGATQDRPTAEPAAPRKDRPFLHHHELLGLEIVAADADGERRALGAIDDVVVDGRTGRLSHVVVATDRRLRALPWDRLAWSRDAEGATEVVADTTPKAFGALPTLKARDADLVVGRRAVDASARATERTPQSFLLGDLVGVGVLAKGAREPITEITGLVVDCEVGRVAFATMTVERRSLLVPAEALAFRPRTPRGEEARRGDAARQDAEEVDSEPEILALLTRQKDALDGAPAIDAEKGETAANPRFRSVVYRFYRLPDPDEPAKRARD